MRNIRPSLLAGIACVAAFVVTAPIQAHAEGPRPWFGGNSTAGSGTEATQTREVADFEAIEVAGPINVKVRQTEREGVEVRADDNLLALLETVVEPSGKVRTLHVRWKRGESLRPRVPAVVTVDVVRLSAVSTRGSGDLHVGALKTSALQVSLSGSGDAVLQDLSADSLRVSVAGSGNVRAAGSAAQVKVSIAGSGDVSLLDLRASQVSVSIAGSGDAAVHAEKSLQVSIAGSGDVEYRGDPEVKSSVTGSGSVRRLQ